MMTNGQQGLAAVGIEAPREEMMGAQGQAPEDGDQGMDQQQVQEVVMQVVQALMSGMSPDELIQRGVPAEVVQMAIQIIQEQSQGQGGQPAHQGSGLSTMQA